MRLVRLLPLFVVLLIVSCFSAQAEEPVPAAIHGAPESSPGHNIPLRSQDDALVILSTLDVSSLDRTITVVRNNGGEVPQAYPPNALVATLNPQVELALRQHPAVARIERGVVDPASLTALGGQAELAAHIWNRVFRGVPDPLAPPAPPGPPPEPDGPDLLIPPPEPPAVRTVPGAPSSTQTSEFMAGTVVYSVVFVESDSATTGNCSPPDSETEDWDGARQTTVLSKIAEGLAFWTARSNRPDPLTFLLDNQGTQPTSCEPITRPSSDELRWVADVLTAMGFPATTSNYYTVARSFANARRTAVGADWGYLIFVVDSLNDADGKFSDDWFAYAYLNGPFMVMTYDNDGWEISRMHLVTAHETGHIFGALDEYASSGCSTADSWGYLNVANASCNNGGITTDKSIMGEGSEQTDPAVDVSTSARGAIGWRNPAGAIVDVVRTATASLTPYTPDPTSDNTPTYSASAGNTPYPPGGCNTIGGICYRWPSSATVSKVAGAEWNLDGGAFTSDGVVPTDGAFDEETDPYTFTPQSPVASGTRTFGTRSTNNFGHISSVATDTLTITLPDQDGDTVADDADNCPETYDTSNADNDGDGIPGTQPPSGATWGGDVCDDDDDNDVMPDTYEDAYACLDPLVADHMTNDDSDELINYAEMMVGTDPCVANPELALQSDGDGWSDGRERYVGTDPLDGCPDDLYDDAWPPDVNGGGGCGASHNGEVDILDVLCYKPVLGGVVGDPVYNRRFDLNADGEVDILDVLLYKPVLHILCTNP